MTDDEQVMAGQRAEHAMSVLDPAMEQVKAAILREMVQTSPQQADKVLALHRSVQIVEAVRQAINEVVSNGKVASVAIASAGLTRR